MQSWRPKARQLIQTTTPDTAQDAESQAVSGMSSELCSYVPSKTGSVRIGGFEKVTTALSTTDTIISRSTVP